MREYRLPTLLKWSFGSLGGTSSDRRESWVGYVIEGRKFEFLLLSVLLSFSCRSRISSFLSVRRKLILCCPWSCGGSFVFSIKLVFLGVNWIWVRPPFMSSLEVFLCLEEPWELGTPKWLMFSWIEAIDCWLLIITSGVCLSLFSSFLLNVLEPAL